MSNRARPRSDAFRRFAWAQAALGPIYFGLAALSGKPAPSMAALRGAVVGSLLSAVGLDMPARSRSRG
jgi:hypothetical protein